MKKSAIFLSLMCLTSFQLQAQTPNCCCTDCTCPAGPQGPIGPQGVLGVTGPQGIPGDQGSVGPQGVQGIMGATGEQGPCCPIVKVSAGVNSQINQTLVGSPGMNLPGGVVLFQNSPTSPINVDTSAMSTTGELTFLVTGQYRVFWTVEGNVEAAAPFPVPAFAFSLFLDNVPVAGSTFATLITDTPGTISYLGGAVLMNISAGQKLKLANTSTNNVHITSTAPGATQPLVSASLIVSLQ